MCHVANSGLLYSQKFWQNLTQSTCHSSIPVPLSQMSYQYKRRHRQWHTVIHTHTMSQKWQLNDDFMFTRYNSYMFTTWCKPLTVLYVCQQFQFLFHSSEKF